MQNPNLVNIGTERKEVLVPSDAVSGDPKREERYWRGVVLGSTFPSSQIATDQKALDLLLKRKK